MNRVETKFCDLSQNFKIMVFMVHPYHFCGSTCGTQVGFSSKEVLALPANKHSKYQDVEKTVSLKSV